MSTPKPSVHLDDADVIRLGRTGVGRRPHARPHPRPPLPVRPGRGHPALGRPRPAHHHAPHLRDGHRRRPAGAVLRLARPHARPARASPSPSPPTAIPSPGWTSGSRPSRSTTRSGSSCCARRRSSSAGRRRCAELSTHLFSPRAQGPMADERDLRPPRAPAPGRPRQGHLGRRPAGVRRRLGLRRRSPLRFDRLLLASLGNASGHAAVRSAAGRTHRSGTSDWRCPGPARPGGSVTETRHSWRVLAQFGIRRRVRPASGRGLRWWRWRRRCRVAASRSHSAAAPGRSTMATSTAAPGSIGARCSSSARSGARSSRRRASSSSTASQ